MATQRSTAEAPVAVAHASAAPGRVAGRRVAGRSWRSVLAWPFRARDGIWLESAGPAPGEVRGERVVGQQPILQLVDTVVGVAVGAMAARTGIWVRKFLSPRSVSPDPAKVRADSPERAVVRE